MVELSLNLLGYICGSSICSLQPPIIQKARRIRSPKFSFLLTMLMPMLVFLISFTLASSSSIHLDSLSRGSALSVDNPGDILCSPNGVFSAGFLSVGNNAYAFAVWFNNQSCIKDCIVWMANRDELVSRTFPFTDLNILRLSGPRTLPYPRQPILFS